MYRSGAMLCFVRIMSFLNECAPARRAYSNTHIIFIYLPPSLIIPSFDSVPGTALPQAIEVDLPRVLFSLD